MFWKKNKDKNFNIIFISSSLLAFAFFLIIFMVNSLSSNMSNQKKLLLPENEQNTKFFINKDYSHKDPYTTKIPSLKDMIVGPIITDLDPSIGNKKAKVTLVLFSDFECESCAKQEKILKEAMSKYDVRLVWKDYPASDPESRSYQASISARCAQEQNTFWEYHDKVFASESDLTKETFLKIADELKLDTDDFLECLDKTSAANLVHDNMLEAEALGIMGVPFLYVNDKEILGEISKEDLEKEIELELKKQE